MLQNVTKIDQSELLELYNFTIKHGSNIIAFGPPGIGKTEIARQAIFELGYRCGYINLSVLEAPDFVGIPQIKDGFSTWAPPEFLPFTDKEEDEPPMVLLVDEIDKAKPELQNPLLEILQFRTINNKALNVKAVLATGNRPDDMAFSMPVSHALTNRCSIYDVENSFSAWQKWARDNSVNNLVVGFLSKNQEWLLKPKSTGDSTEYCFPSPRSWTCAAHDLNLAWDKSISFKYNIIAGRVGTVAATEFRVWLEHYRKIEPHITELIDNGTHPQFDGHADQIFICALAVVKELSKICKQLYRNINQYTEQKEAIERIINNTFPWLQTIPSEYCVAALKSSLSKLTVREHKLTEYKEFMDIFAKIEKSSEGR